MCSLQSLFDFQGLMMCHRNQPHPAHSDPAQYAEKGILSYLSIYFYISNTILTYIIQYAATAAHPNSSHSCGCSLPWC